MSTVLYYCHDPMCSWCWAFKDVYSQLCSALSDEVAIKTLLGGLAPDTEEPMAADMQHYLQNTWKTIQKRVPGSRFNIDFWTKCRPRRSTYAACRAVIAARHQGQQYADLMTTKIQTAYYTEARNPSEQQLLIALAKELGLDVAQFADDINAEQTRQQLHEEIEQCRRLGVDSFPALVLNVSGSYWQIPLDYNHVDPMLDLISQIIKEQDE